MEAEATRAYNAGKGEMGKRANEAAGNFSGVYSASPAGQSYSKSGGSADALSPQEAQNAKQFVTSANAKPAANTNAQTNVLGDGMPTKGADGETRYDAADINLIRKTTATQKGSAAKLLGS